MRTEFAQLQQLDQRLAQQVRARDDLLAALGERDVLRALGDAVTDALAQLKQERANSSELQWELEEVEVRLRALHEQDEDGPTDPLVARELALLHKRRAELEEHILQQLEQIAEGERALQQVDQDYNEQRAAWTEREPVVLAKLEQIAQTIDALHAEREHIAARLSPALGAQYDELQRRHRGTAFAPIRSHQCSVCHARLPAAVFDMLANPDALVRCPRCGRVVYSED